MLMPRKADISTPKAATTIRDVARAVGLSIATVSRTLSFPDRVNPATRRKVLAAVHSLGYRPNRLAQYLRSGQTRLILILVPVLSTYFLEIMDGAEMAAMEEGYSVLLANTRGNITRAETLLTNVSERRADGILLLSGAVPEALGARGARLPPIVIVAEPARGAPASSVVVDHCAAARTAVQHLVGLGHRRLGYIEGRHTAPRSIEQLRGFKKEAKIAGIPTSALSFARGDFTVRSGENAMSQLLQLSSPPTAVFTGNDEMAMGAIRAAQLKGLKVPEDLSVVGVDNNQHLLDVFAPALTTIDVPRYDLGYTAMKRLALELHQQQTPVHIELPTRLIVRSTTSGPRPDLSR
jgi:LacI family transcriptional regulator, repressor for deo operon, udp, cdd, tsx, nupC, and nupG